MSQKKKDTTNGQKKPAKKDQPQLGQTSLSSWFTQRPVSETQPSENNVKVLTRGSKNSPGESPVISPIGSPKKRASKSKEEIVLSHTLDKIDAKGEKVKIEEKKKVKIEEKKSKKADVKEEKGNKEVKKSKKVDIKEEKGEKEEKKSKKLSSSKKTSPTKVSPITSPVSSPEKRKKSKVVISDSDSVDDVMKIEDSVDVEDIVKEVEAMHSLKRHRADSVISINDAQEEISRAKNATKTSTTSNKKAKTEKGAKKTTPTKVKKESKSMDVDGEVTSSADAIDPRHPNFRPLTNFRIGMASPQPPNPGSKIIPEGTANCLAGKIFIITGTLDSLQRDEAKELIAKHGGVVNDTLTKKITHVLLGDQFGGAKMLKILKMELMTYNEDELLEIIRSSKPQDPTKTLPVVAEVKHVFVPKEGTSHFLWADKYKPESMTDLVGNSISINKIKKWLENWQTNLENDEKKTFAKRAVLITGPPGIGKTTTAMILAKELGFEAIVTNASDTRNVSSLQDLLKTNDNKSIAGFMSFVKPSAPQTPKKLIYIMDEIDGMSQGDKGGIGELCRIIPNTKTPIICIANDRFTKKLQPLIKHCEDCPFDNPPLGQILNRVSVIVKAENYNISQANLIKVIESTHGDFRQVLNLLQMWSYSEVENNNNGTISKESIDLATKDFTLCSEDTIPMFFSRNIPLHKKFDAWFVDYNFTPCIIQDRYLSGMPRNNSIESIARAADSISDGDLMGESIFRKQDFELLPIHGLMSAIIPGHHAHTGGRKAYSPFPIWFSKNKSEQSHRDQLFTIQKNTNNHLFSDPEAIGMEYTHLLSHFLTNSMINDGKEGCQEVMDFMNSYGLTLEDRDSILEYHKTFGEDLAAKITSQTKAAFTRLYNAEHWTVKENKGSGKKKAEKKGDKATPKSTTVKKKENVELDMNDMKAKPKKKAAAPKKTTK